MESIPVRDSLCRVKYHDRTPVSRTPLQKTKLKDLPFRLKVPIRLYHFAAAAEPAGLNSAASPLKGSRADASACDRVLLTR
jgi:hypothetical protein